MALNNEERKALYVLTELARPAFKEQDQIEDKIYEYENQIRILRERWRRNEDRNIELERESIIPAVLTLRAVDDTLNRYQGWLTPREIHTYTELYDEEDNVQRTGS